MSEKIEVADNEKCSIRGGSFHVGYVLNEPDGYEAQNLTHAESTSDDDLGDYEIEVGWVLEDDDPGLAMLHIFEADDQTVWHRLPTETLFQLADMFILAATRCREREVEHLEKERYEEARILAEDVEIARMHQPLPFKD